MTFVRYADCSFSGDGKTFDRVWVGGDVRDFKVGDLYVRDASGEVHNLRLLKEETVKEWVEEEPNGFIREDMVGHTEYDGMDLTIYRFPMRTLLFFHEGKLVDAGLINAPDSPFSGLEVAKDPEGEFLKLPVKHEDLVRVFGKPEEIERASLSGQ